MLLIHLTIDLLYIPRVKYHLPIQKVTMCSDRKFVSELDAKKAVNLIRALYWTALVIPSPSGVEVAISPYSGCYYNNRESGSGPPNSSQQRCRR